MQNSFEATRISTTSATVVSVIDSLQFGGVYLINLTGDISSCTINNIDKALNRNKSVQIFLDLSNTSNLFSINDNTFCNCENIVGITLPNSVKEIGDNFCSNSSLTSINIPNGVIRIGKDSFSYCTKLKSVSLSSSVSSIYRKVFSGCKNLNSFSVEDKNINFSTSADGKMLLSKDKQLLICYPSASEDVVIPDYITQIGMFAFFDCDNLKSVTIPNNVTEFKTGAFSKCFNLTSFTVDANNPIFSVSSDKRILLSKDKKTIVAYPSASDDVIISNNVTEIGSFAFTQCNTLTNVVLSKNICKLGQCAFASCKNLRTITINKNMTSEYDLFFLDCNNLSTFIVASDNPVYSSSTDGTMLLSKDKSTIIACPAASGNINIPSYVTKINQLAFCDCSYISSITFNAPTSWFYTTNKDYTNGTPFDVTDSGKNATIFQHYYWYRK